VVRSSHATVFNNVGFATLILSSALLASPGAPQQSPPGLAENEAAALATLRQIAAAEARVKADGTIDTNCDGVGEYGYLAELAGTVPKRVCKYDYDGGKPAAGSTWTDIIVRPLLRASLGHTRFSSVIDSGYRFMVWLPDSTTNGEVGAFREDFLGGKQAAPFPDPRNGAGLWCCYAWPLEAGVTGTRAFFVNQEGIVLQCDNKSSIPFSGQYRYPDFGEALQRTRDMSSALRIGPPAGGAHNTVWTLVQ